RVVTMVKDLMPEKPLVRYALSDSNTYQSSTVNASQPPLSHPSIDGSVVSSLSSLHMQSPPSHPPSPNYDEESEVELHYFTLIMESEYEQGSNSSSSSSILEELDKKRNRIRLI
ncbi:10779_t:CDS:2, partial [Ambispora gerdemannii]